MLNLPRISRYKFRVNDYIVGGFTHSIYRVESVDKTGAMCVRILSGKYTYFSFDGGKVYYLGNMQPEVGDELLMLLCNGRYYE